MSGFARSVVVGGSGAVGGMFTRLLREAGSRTLVVDVAPPPEERDTCLVADITAPGPELAAALGRADLVLLAVHEAVALKAVAPVTRLMRSGALLADTLSVRTGMAAELTAHAPGVEHVGLNPMFHPVVGMAGRPMAVVITRDGPGVAALLRLVERGGGRPVRLSAEEHDRTTAATQALTHAVIVSFGIALARLGVDVRTLTETAPPPHQVLLALLARVLGGSPKVYGEIQWSNPRAASARRALADALHSFASLVGDDPDLHNKDSDGDGHRETEGLDSVFDELRRLMGPELTAQQDRCRELFRTIHRTDDEGETDR
ncbi:prephenate dehydrogenase/arogenate dehydrogenase family protein [Streptomyces sp. ACA25]|uniref:prephenate dehydrogenase dimerization domain-containing protein n=1 Tax=Streptomyces sp. ACA25 TaxID=3022596 RepID=UPI0023079858|nr:prephenate dehydrogenase dimerization domain-containing protein [Streptomyces sp. ACA25]MDB1090285.1 prephenate dehydrogenase/arogenate dehydrogenase family protein [Streptomyces sp. ACA25]